MADCEECVEPDEDPRPWCDCEPGDTCKGPCRNRAHDPERCPEWPEPPAEIPPLTLAAVVSPGDSLVIGFSRPVTMEEFEGVRAAFEARLPGVKVLIVDGVASMTVMKGGESNG